jgi:hypothetical protein
MGAERGRGDARTAARILDAAASLMTSLTAPAAIQD